jgi:hypothetical protein
MLKHALLQSHPQALSLPHHLSLLHHLFLPVWQPHVRLGTFPIQYLTMFTLYALESACVKIVWQREFLLQEVKGLKLEVWGETLL